MAASGSVLFNFNKIGVLMVPQEGLSEDEIVELALEAGAEDVIPKLPEEEGGVAFYKVSTAPEDWASVRDALAESNVSYEAELSGLVLEPSSLVSGEEEMISANEKIIERLLDLDDVDAVYSNLDLS